MARTASASLRGRGRVRGVRNANCGADFAGVVEDNRWRIATTADANHCRRDVPAAVHDEVGDDANLLFGIVIDIRLINIGG